MNVSEIRNRILNIYQEQEKLDKELKTNIQDLQTQCKHDTVVETDFKSSYGASFSSMPPRRICVTCSLEEEGWSSGYKKLRYSVVLKVFGNRDEFFKYRKMQPL